MSITNTHKVGSMDITTTLDGHWKINHKIRSALSQTQYRAGRSRRSKMRDTLIFCILSSFGNNSGEGLNFPICPFSGQEQWLSSIFKGKPLLSSSLISSNETIFGIQCHRVRLHYLNTRKLFLKYECGASYFDSVSYLFGELQRIVELSKKMQTDNRISWWLMKH